MTEGTLLDREEFRALVSARISESMREYCRENSTEHIWREPVVGFADARSELFPGLRDIAYPGHLMPDDILPGARTVISYFLPFDGRIGGSNIGGTLPSGAWADAYGTTNSMAPSIGEAVCGLLEGLGFRAAVPADTGQVEGTYSLWSQRHVARIAGIGTFGMNNMLISGSGCCGRYFSVVTDMAAEPDAPPEEERCLFKRTGGCGVCMDRCVCGAIGGDGFSRESCLEVCEGNIPLTGHSICGKCVVGLPCSSRDPSSGTIR